MSNTKTKLAIAHGFTFAGEAFSLAMCLKNEGKTEEALAALKVAIESDDAQDLADTFNTVNAAAIEAAGLTEEEFQEDVDEDSEEVKAALTAIASMLETSSDDENFDDEEDDEEDFEDDSEFEDKEDEEDDEEEDSEFSEPDSEDDMFGEDVKDDMTASEERGRRRRKERQGKSSHNQTLARAIANKASLGKRVKR